MDIADPDELVTFAVDPTAGSHSFYTSYNNAQVIADTKKAEQTFDDRRAPAALQRDPEAGGRRRVPGLPLLLALQLRLQHQGQRFPGLPDRQLPPRRRDPRPVRHLAFLARRLVGDGPGADRHLGDRLLHDPPGAGRPGPDAARRPGHRRGRRRAARAVRARPAAVAAVPVVPRPAAARRPRAARSSTTPTSASSSR